MPARRVCLGLPLLLGCNALLDIDAHDLGSHAGAPGASDASGGSSVAGANAGGSRPESSGGIGASNGGEAGTTGEGGDLFGGMPGTGGLGGGLSAGGTGVTAGGSVSAGGTANAVGGSASSTGGTVTTNACNLECPANQVCVEGACVDCRNAERRCSADETPLLCVEQTWVEQTACGGAAPLCSNGACVGVRLLGGLVSVQGALSSSRVRLVQGSVGLTKPTCSTALAKCVVGGLRP